MDVDSDSEIPEKKLKLSLVIKGKMDQTNQKLTATNVSVNAGIMDIEDREDPPMRVLESGPPDQVNTQNFESLLSYADKININVGVTGNQPSSDCPLQDHKKKTTISSPSNEYPKLIFFYKKKFEIEEDNAKPNSFDFYLDLRSYKPEDITVKVINICVILVEAKGTKNQESIGRIPHFSREYTVPDGYNTNLTTAKLYADKKLKISVPLSETSNGEHIFAEKTVPLDLLKEKLYICPKDTVLH